MKDIFGNKDSRPGAKIPSQNEWNQLNNSLTNLVTGANNFHTPEVNEYGAQMPFDSFFFPHIGQVDYNRTDAIIGPDREAEYYPYVDSMSVETITETTQLELVNGEFTSYGIGDKDTSSTAVLFTTPSIIEPTKPAVNTDASIVGYEWNLVPEVISAEFLAGGTLAVIKTQWKAGDVFADDTQAQLYTEDAGQDTKAWGPSSFESTTSTDFEDLINDYLTAEAEPNIILSTAANVPKYNKTIKVPIARYDWNVDQSLIDRVVQIYFGGSAAASSGVQEPGESALLQHPFKGSVSSTDIVIGARRSDLDYQFKDSITITDPDTDLLYSIDYPTPETISLDTADYYVYYDLYKNGTIWESTLKKSTTWPPTISVGNIAKLIGYAGSTDTGSTDNPNTYVWGQEMFDCPNEQVADIRGEFEPYYELDGYVTIADGTVETFSNGPTTASGATYNLSTNTDIWVTATSNESASGPSVTISGLHSGTYPGFYQDTSSSQDKFHVKIGEILDGVYVPAHKGRVHIDATLLTPQISDDYESDPQTPRLMAFHDNQTASVGLVSNDKLIDAEFLLPNIRGGTFQEIQEGSAVEIYGLTQDATATDFVSSVASSTQSIVFSSASMEIDFDHGLAQKAEFEAGSNFVIGDSGWVGFDVSGDGSNIIHKNSPASSTDSPYHWFTETMSRDGGGTVTLSVDDLGHVILYAVNTDAASSQPEYATSHRYSHCSDTTSYADLLFTSQQANTVIEVDGECYEYKGTTQDLATDPVPTVTDTFASCSSCATSGQNQQWKRCSDDTNIAIFSGGVVTNDYAWIQDGGVYVKCYNDTTTISTPTSPQPCFDDHDTAPTSCNSLTGNRHNVTVTHGECDGNGKYDCNNGHSFTTPKTSDMNLDGDFTLEIDCTINSNTACGIMDARDDDTDSSNLWELLYAGSGTIQFYVDTSAFGRLCNLQASWTYTSSTVRFTVERSGSTWRLYINGTQGASATNANHLSGKSGGLKIPSGRASDITYSNVAFHKTALHSGNFTPSANDFNVTSNTVYRPTFEGLLGSKCIFDQADP